MNYLIWLFFFFVIPAKGGEEIFSEYRDLMGDDNPAIFVIEEGKEFWYTPEGNPSASLETCDLGLGSGVTKDAYVHFPRYFEDVDAVMDIETRLVHCMVMIQGRDRQIVLETAYSLRGDLGTELEALVAWLASESEGTSIAPQQTHPEENRMYELGESVFFFRAGPHDFSCATCHEQTDKRIRLQSLPDLTTYSGAAEAYASWPAYRISQGLVRTMGWRLQDCFRQQRWPELILGSEVSIALQTYLAVNAAGAKMISPGLKR